MAFFGGSSNNSGKERGQDSNKMKDIPKVGTILGNNTHFIGNLKGGSDTIRIEGQFDGDIESEGDVIIVDGATVNGNINAKNSVISGHFKGNIDSNGCLEITRTGVVVANVSVHKLVIDEGACFNGQSNMKSAPADEIKALPSGPSSTK